MLFVPCVVVQLCNIKQIQVCDVNQQKYALQINVLIQFFLSSTCLEHLTFIVRKTIQYCTVHAALYGTFSMHLCKQSTRLKDVLDT